MQRIKKGDDVVVERLKKRFFSPSDRRVPLTSLKQLNSVQGKVKAWVAPVQRSPSKVVSPRRKTPFEVEQIDEYDDILDELKEVFK